ncbi:hypothetical protein [Tunturiibacter gelidiferens]|uniref:hypothetical protein n=1 Tax=Tunturiibacter gelidiferens TaxID=3069689 RepID=UPI003D9BADF5
MTPAQAESKDINVAKAAPSHPGIVVGTKVQKKAEEAETQVVEPVGNTEENQTETAVVAQVAPTASLQTERAIPPEQAVGNQIQLPLVQTPASQREALATTRTQEVAPEKKTATKTQAGDATQPAVSAKNGAATVSPTADEMKSTHGVAAQVVVQAANPIPAHIVAASALPVATAAPAMPVATSNVAVNLEGGKNVVGPGAGSLSGGTLSGAAPAAADGLASSKNTAHGTKTPVSDRETVAAPGDPTAPAKPDAKEERLQAVSENAGGDSDAKTRLTGEPPVTTVHIPAPGADATAGAATSVVTGLTKLSGGGGGTSTGGSSNGLREQDSSGSVARSSEPMPRTLSATPTALEVGIPDGTHGWLKVRAEMADGGVVNASVSAASAASQEMLHRELPSLTAYLQSEKVAVNTVVVHPTASAGAEPRGYPAGTESGGSGQTPQRSNEGGEQGRGPLRATAEVTDDVAGYQGLHGVGEDATLPPAAYPGGGSWLSVRA